LWKTVWRKLKIELPYDSATPLLNIYSDKTVIQKKYMHPYVHTQNSQDINKCPSTNEWIKKIWYIYTM